MAAQPLRLRKWGNPFLLVASLFFLMYTPGHVNIVLKMSHHSPLPARNSVASNSWPWLLGFTFPTLSSQSRHRCQAPRVYGALSCLQALAAALPLDRVSSLRPHFLPFEALLAPHGCFLLCSPRVVFTSLSSTSHGLLWMTDGRIHLSSSSTIFTCLEAETVSYSFLYPPARDILWDTE